MFSKKNHIGRPTNEEIKNRKIKKILIISMPILLVIFISILFYTKGDMSKLMGNSVISSTHFDYELVEEKRDDCSFSRSSNGKDVEYYNMDCPYKLNLKVSITSSGIYISWDDVKQYLADPKDFMYYKVTINPINTNNKVSAVTVDINNNSYLYKDNWYEIGSEFSVSVYAYAFHQKSPWVAIHSLKYKVIPKENLNLQVDSYEDGINLSWNKISNATYYVVEKEKDDNIWDTWEEVGRTTSTSYYDKDIKAMESKYYRVNAYDYNNKKIATKIYDKWVYTTAEAASIVSSTITSSGFNLKMKGGYNAEKYEVYIKENENFKKVGVSSKDEFEWTGATNNNKYVFKVKSLDKNNKETSVFSKEYQTQTFYSAPVISSINEIGSGVALLWSKVSGISKYAVYVKGGIYKDYKKVKETKSNAATVIMMFPAGTYTFKVVGISDSGFEATSYVEKKYVVELKKQSKSVKATLSYSCPSGYTKSGSGSNIKCTKTQTTTASKRVKEYQCAPISGIKKIGSKCQHTYAASRSYSCPSGYTKIGDGPNASCEKSEKPVTKTTTYCSGGTKWLLRNGQCEYQQQASSRCSKGSLSSGKCVYTYNASIKNRRYTCPNGGTLNGSAKCVLKTNPSYTCPTFQDVRGSLKNRTCYYYKKTTTGKTQVCNKGYLYASRCILTAKTTVKYICPSTAKQSGASCIKTTDAAVVYEYYCPNGYTKSGSGSSMKCSKKSTTNATATYKCPSGYKKTGSGANTKCTK